MMRSHGSNYALAWLPCIIILAGCNVVVVSTSTIPEPANVLGEIDKLMEILNWKSAAIIQDKNTGYFNPRLLQTVHLVNGSDIFILLTDLHRIMFTEINILLLLEKRTMFDVISKINNHDKLSGGTTDYRHHSKLCVFATDVGEMNSVQYRVQDLENIIVVIPNMNGSAMFSHRTEVDGTTTYDGYVFDVWKAIADTLNFSYIVIQPKDESYGVQLNNGTWNGFVRQLVLNEADIVVVDMTVTYERAQHVDFINTAIKIEDSALVYKREATNNSDVGRVAKPLTSGVYLVVCVTVFGTLILYLIVEDVAKRPISGGTVLTNLVDRSLILFGAIFRQEIQSKRMSGSTAGNILTATWCLLMLVVTSMYSANLIASLATETPLNKISDIEELVESDYSAGVVSGGFGITSLKQSTRPIIQRLYQKMLKHNLTYGDALSTNKTKLLQQVERGHYALIVYRSEGETMARQNCLLDVIKESVTLSHEKLSFAVRKNSPLKPDIDRVMLRLQETGLLEYWWTKRNFKHSRCQLDRRLKPVTIIDIGGGFICLCGGVVLSLVVLLLEKIYNRVYYSSMNI